jgi:hypothetical protein
MNQKRCEVADIQLFLQNEVRFFAENNIMYEVKLCFDRRTMWSCLTIWDCRLVMAHPHFCWLTCGTMVMRFMDMLPHVNHIIRIDSVAQSRIGNYS